AVMPILGIMTLGFVKFSSSIDVVQTTYQAANRPIILIPKIGITATKTWNTFDSTKFCAIDAIPRASAAHNNPAAKNDRVESNAFVNVKGIISWLIKNIALISAIE
ncbi:hypothetical protein, partial [Mycoplasmopsis bovis]|uniref:hypothetical protein n=1 Tax=Mycoplasmopsis bovis TaxID=28903 RepID=UPI003D267545